MIAPLLGVSVACATANAPSDAGDANPAVGARGDTRTLTEADLASSEGKNLLDVIRAQRPRWLQAPFTASSNSNSLVRVFIGDAPAGEISALSGINASVVARVRYYDVTEARQRFAVRDLSPVIQVVLK